LDGSRRPASGHGLPASGSGVGGRGGGQGRRAGTPPKVSGQGLCQLRIEEKQIKRRVLPKWFNWFSSEKSIFFEMFHFVQYDKLSRFCNELYRLLKNSSLLTNTFVGIIHIIMMFYEISSMKLF
jgi:hypothetical protein